MEGVVFSGARGEVDHEDSSVIGGKCGSSSTSRWPSVLDGPRNQPGPGR